MSLADRWPLADHDVVRDQLVAAWDRPGYHDLTHLGEVLDHLDELSNAGAAFDPVTVGLAAWFHDAVYDAAPGAEERSAQWAEHVLPPELAAEVSRLVRLTERHRPAPGDANGAALCDADLAILASDRERYDEYVAGVRAEFATLTEAEFAAGRRAVLLELQDKSELFETIQARAMWESPARANLARELAGLSAT